MVLAHPVRSLYTFFFLPLPIVVWVSPPMLPDFLPSTSFLLFPSSLLLPSHPFPIPPFPLRDSGFFETCSAECTPPYSLFSLATLTDLPDNPLGDPLQGFLIPWMMGLQIGRPVGSPVIKASESHCSACMQSWQEFG